MLKKEYIMKSHKDQNRFMNDNNLNKNIDINKEKNAIIHW